jgi:hypothetical protein
VPADRVDDLVAAVTGVPAEVLAQARRTVATAGDPLVRAATPLAALSDGIAELVAVRAAADEPERPATVVDELLFWRGCSRDRMPLGDLAALVTALTAAAWDATWDATRLGAPGAGGPGRCAWLRVTTRAVLLGGARIAAGERCLLVVGATPPDGRPVRPALTTLRWLSPTAPEGAAATLAGLVTEALTGGRPGAPRDRPEVRERPWSPERSGRHEPSGSPERAGVRESREPGRSRRPAAVECRPAAPAVLPRRPRLR